MTFRRVIAALTLLLSLNTGVFAQDNGEKKIPFSMGGYLGGNLNMHSPDYIWSSSNYAGVINPAHMLDFTNSASSLGLHGGFIINYPFSNTVVLSGRLGLHGAGAELDGSGFYGINTQDGTDTSYAGTFDNSLIYFEISPMLQFHNLLPDKNVYFLAGLELGLPLNTDFEYAETRRITQPEPQPSLTQNGALRSNPIDKPELRYALGLGIGYMLELDRTTFLSPELSFRIPFSGVSSNDQMFRDWKFSQLRLGVSLTFDISGGGADPVPVADTEEESTMSIRMKEIRAYDNNNNVKTVDKITLEEVQYTELFPLVPYVFYDQGKDAPSAKYQRLSTDNTAGKFAISDLEPNAEKINQSTLDILGTRMQQYPNSTVTLTGTNDNIKEKGNKDLSMKRAENAKNYLVVNYGINPDRISLQAAGLPGKPSSSKDMDGVEENRRIEFTSAEPALLEPILIQKEKQALADPKTVEFVTEINSTDSVKSWQLELSQADKVIKTYSGSGNPDNLQWSIQPNDLTNSSIPVEYAFTAENVKNVSAQKTGTIPVDYISTVRKKSEERPDRSISKYSLILFDFDSPAISENDKAIIDKQIAPSVKYNSTIQVYGYSDRIGDKKYNKELALKRASTVADYIKSKTNSQKVEVYGVGEDIAPYDNNSAIGRHLSRTVQVYIITPKEN